MGQLLKVCGVIVGAVALGIAAIQIGKTTNATAAAENAPVAPEPTSWWSYSPRQIFETFDSNELKAEADFKGKRVRIVGLVGTVQRDNFGTAFVTLQAGPLKKPSTRDTSILMQMQQEKGQFVRCALRPDAMSGASGLAHGGLIAVDGRGQRLDPLEMEFTDCTVSWVWTPTDRTASLPTQLLARAAEFCLVPRLMGMGMGQKDPEAAARLVTIASQAEKALGSAGITPECDHPLLPLIISCEGEAQRPECLDFIMKANAQMARDEKMAGKTSRAK
jgi:hypothetical protein